MCTFCSLIELLPGILYGVAGGIIASWVFHEVVNVRKKSSMNKEFSYLSGKWEHYKYVKTEERFISRSNEKEGKPRYTIINHKSGTNILMLEAVSWEEKINEIRYWSGKITMDTDMDTFGNGYYNYEDSRKYAPQRGLLNIQVVNNDESEVFIFSTTTEMAREKDDNKRVTSHVWKKTLN